MKLSEFLVWALPAAVLGQTCDAESDPTCSEVDGDYFDISASFPFALDEKIERGRLILDQTDETTMKLKFESRTMEIKKGSTFHSQLVDAIIKDQKFVLHLTKNDKHLKFPLSACKLAAANFQEQFSLNMFIHEEFIELLGFHVDPVFSLGVVEDCKTLEYRSDLADSVKSGDILLKSKAKVIFPIKTSKEEDFRVEAVAAQNKAEEITAKKQKDGEATPEEEQSFLRRYWYVFLPMIAMNVIGGMNGGNTEPEAATKAQKPAPVAKKKK